jgi:hypothetical protein
MSGHDVGGLNGPEVSGTNEAPTTSELGNVMVGMRNTSEIVVLSGNCFP